MTTSQVVHFHHLFHHSLQMILLLVQLHCHHPWKNWLTPWHFMMKHLLDFQLRLLQFTTIYDDLQNLLDYSSCPYCPCRYPLKNRLHFEIEDGRSAVLHPCSTGLCFTSNLGAYCSYPLNRIHHPPQTHHQSSHYVVNQLLSH